MEKTKADWKRRIDKFEGKKFGGNAKKLKGFINEYELHANTYAWSEEDKVKFLCSSLEGVPRRHCMQHTANGSKPFSNWKKATEFLDRYYGETVNSAEKLKQLGKRKQKPGESEMEYYWVLRQLASEAVPADKVEDTVLGLFIEGVRGAEARKLLGLSRPTTIEEALQLVRIAKQFEEVEPRRRQGVEQANDNLDNQSEKRLLNANHHQKEGQDQTKKHQLRNKKLHQPGSESGNPISYLQNYRKDGSKIKDELCSQAKSSTSMVSPIFGQERCIHCRDRGHTTSQCRLGYNKCRIMEKDLVEEKSSLTGNERCKYCRNKTHRTEECESKLKRQKIFNGTQWKLDRVSIESEESRKEQNTGRPKSLAGLKMMRSAVKAEPIVIDEIAEGVQQEVIEEIRTVLKENAVELTEAVETDEEETRDKETRQENKTNPLKATEKMIILKDRRYNWGSIKTRTDQFRNNNPVYQKVRNQRCRKCRRKNHTPSQCRINCKYCKICNEPGHKEVECIWEMQKNQTSQARQKKTTNKHIDNQKMDLQGKAHQIMGVARPSEKICCQRCVAKRHSSSGCRSPRVYNKTRMERPEKTAKEQPDYEERYRFLYDSHQFTSHDIIPVSGPSPIKVELWNLEPPLSHDRSGVLVDQWCNHQEYQTEVGEKTEGKLCNNTEDRTSKVNPPHGLEKCEHCWRGTQAIKHCKWIYNEQKIVVNDDWPAFNIRKNQEENQPQASQLKETNHSRNFRMTEEVAHERFWWEGVTKRHHLDDYITTHKREKTARLKPDSRWKTLQSKNSERIPYIKIMKARKISQSIIRRIIIRKYQRDRYLRRKRESKTNTLQFDDQMELTEERPIGPQLVIMITINNINIEALLDTGAAISVISRRKADLLQGHRARNQRTVITVEGRTINLVESMRCQIGCHGKTTTHQVSVMDIEDDFILGTDLIPNLLSGESLDLGVFCLRKGEEASAKKYESKESFTPPTVLKKRNVQINMLGAVGEVEIKLQNTQPNLLQEINEEASKHQQSEAESKTGKYCTEIQDIIRQLSCNIDRLDILDASEFIGALNNLNTVVDDEHSKQLAAVVRAQGSVLLKQETEPFTIKVVGFNQIRKKVTINKGDRWCDVVETIKKNTHDVDGLSYDTYFGHILVDPDSIEPVQLKGLWRHLGMELLMLNKTEEPGKRHSVGLKIGHEQRIQQVKAWFKESIKDKLYQDIKRTKEEDFQALLEHVRVRSEEVKVNGAIITELVEQIEAAPEEVKNHKDTVNQVLEKGAKEALLLLRIYIKTQRKLQQTINEPESNSFGTGLEEQACQVQLPTESEKICGNCHKSGHEKNRCWKEFNCLKIGHPWYNCHRRLQTMTGPKVKTPVTYDFKSLSHIAQQKINWERKQIPNPIDRFRRENPRYMGTS